MKMPSLYNILFISVFLIIHGISLADEIADRFTRFDEVEEAMHRLAEQGKADEAFKILEAVRGKFPEDEYQIMDWLVHFNRITGQYDKCLNLWSEGHRKGYFFGIYPGDAIYQPFYTNFRFMKIAEKDSILMAQADEKSKCIYEVQLPDTYSPEKKYPVLIALHGGWGTLTDAKKYWQSDRLFRDFVMIYCQSYIHYDYNSFGWADYDPRARKEFQDIFAEIKEKYSIDTNQVLIGGISAGGVMAADLALNNILPIEGYIGICTARPRELDINIVLAAKERGLRIFMVSGETDYLQPEQDEMVKLFEQADFPYEYHIIKDMGHAYPPDFPDWIDRAIDFIYKK